MPSARALRTIAGYAAVVSALPYLALKMVWLGGGTLGVADLTLMRDPSMIALNVITAGMDLAGIGLALTFTHQWGLRIPAWLLLPPMWVATGLLARFIIAVPIALIVGWLMPAAVPRISGGPVEPWVYAVVYTEFAGMGVGLIVAFFFYARLRWAALLDVQAAAIQKTTRELQVTLANTTNLIASLLGVLFIAWALGATLGLDAAAAARRTIVGSLVNGIDGVLMIGGAVGIQQMVRDPRSASPYWVPVSLTWIGAGSMFGWGLWQTAIVLGQTALVRGAEGMVLANLLGLLRLIAGLVLGLLMIFVLTERGGDRSGQSTSAGS